MIASLSSTLLVIDLAVPAVPFSTSFWSSSILSLIWTCDCKSWRVSRLVATPRRQDSISICNCAISRRAPASRSSLACTGSRVKPSGVWRRGGTTPRGAKAMLRRAGGGKHLLQSFQSLILFPREGAVLLVLLLQALDLHSLRLERLFEPPSIFLEVRHKRLKFSSNTLLALAGRPGLVVALTRFSASTFRSRIFCCFIRADISISVFLAVESAHNTFRRS
jgi:hypothetical protein